LDADLVKKGVDPFSLPGQLFERQLSNKSVRPYFDVHKTFMHDFLSGMLEDIDETYGSIELRICVDGMFVGYVGRDLSGPIAKLA